MYRPSWVMLSPRIRVRCGSGARGGDAAAGAASRLARLMAIPRERSRRKERRRMGVRRSGVNDRPPECGRQASSGRREARRAASITQRRAGARSPDSGGRRWLGCGSKSIGARSRLAASSESCRRRGRQSAARTGFITEGAVRMDSGFLHEAGLERHGAAVDPAVDLVVALDQTDALGLGALLQHLGRAAEL